MPEIEMTKDYVLDIGQIDARGIARPSAVVDFMQDLATRHAAEMGLSQIVAEKGGIFVLSRLKYTLSRPLRSYETVRIRTWPRQLHGAAWHRDYVFSTPDGTELGGAVTVWAIVDVQSHRLLRPKALGMTFEDQIVGKPETLRAIRAEQLTPCFDRVVRYSDIDVNRHLNNVKAVDILSDAFGLEEDESRWVSQMQVNYISESTCGTTLTLARGQNADGTLCVSAFDGETEKVQAKVQFSSL